MSFVKRNQSLKYYEKEVSEDYFIIEKNIIFAGTHIILDLWNCSFSNKIVPLKKIIKEAADLSKAKYCICICTDLVKSKVYQE